jgi:hypothetical protein
MQCMSRRKNFILHEQKLSFFSHQLRGTVIDLTFSALLLIMILAEREKRCENNRESHY